MKVFAVVVLTVASVSALRSGPYLPSGWRPQGPAFLLPSELQKSVENSAEEVTIEETEASGSNAFREYGPPKIEDVQQDIVKQSLPEIVTEQAFVVIETKLNEQEAKSGNQAEVAEVSVTEPKTEVEVQSITESSKVEDASISEQTDVIQGKSIDIDIEASVDNTDAKEETKVTESNVEITEKSIEVIQNETENSNSDITSVEEVSSVENKDVVSLEQKQEIAIEAITVENEKIKEEKVKEEVKTVVEEIKNIADAIVNLESQVKSQEQSIQKESEATTISSGSGSSEAPDALLEYGPPGFREYGPPKDYDLQKLTASVQGNSVDDSIESNEARKRRFSPKFRTLRKL